MFGKRITLFTMFGFAVRIDFSWLIILVLVVSSLAMVIFPETYTDANGKKFPWFVYLAMGLAAALGLFSSIIFHELSHSLVARRYGLPMKGITLFIFGGVAEMSKEPESPKAEFMMAIAGPLSSVLVVGVFYGLALMGGRLGWPIPVTGVLGWIAFMNALLVGFNLIPGFPLDGGRVLRSILWQWKDNLRWATRIASQVGAGFGAVLIGLGFISLLMGGPAIGGMWWILIGLFLRGAAKQGYQQVLIRQALQGEPVSRFMNPNVITVDPELTIEALVDDYVYRYHFKMFPVVEDTRLVGCVTTRLVKEVPRDEWVTRTVGDVARKCSRANTIAPGTDAVKALAQMSRHRLSRLMVVEEDRLVGLVSLKDLMRFLALKVELESTDTPRALPPADTSEE